MTHKTILQKYVHSSYINECQWTHLKIQAQNKTQCMVFSRTCFKQSDSIKIEKKEFNIHIR